MLCETWVPGREIGDGHAFWDVTRRLELFKGVLLSLQQREVRDENLDKIPARSVMFSFYLVCLLRFFSSTGVSLDPGDEGNQRKKEEFGFLRIRRKGHLMRKVVLIRISVAWLRTRLANCDYCSIRLCCPQIYQALMRSARPWIGPKKFSSLVPRRGSVQKPWSVKVIATSKVMREICKEISFRLWCLTPCSLAVRWSLSTMTDPALNFRGISLCQNLSLFPFNATSQISSHWLWKTINWVKSNKLICILWGASDTHLSCLAARQAIAFHDCYEVSLPRAFRQTRVISKSF
jgi:hypothetical protein